MPTPSQHFSKFWPAGVYFWKPGTAPERVQRELMAPADTLHICSEAYSPHSGWGEAALSSAELLLEQLSWVKQVLVQNRDCYSDFQMRATC